MGQYVIQDNYLYNEDESISMNNFDQVRGKAAT